MTDNKELLPCPAKRSRRVSRKKLLAHVLADRKATENFCEEFAKHRNTRTDQEEK